MNMNPSQFLRTVSSLLFVLLFSGIAQASIFQKITRSLPDISQPKIEEVFGILNGLGISTNHLHEDEIRVLARALDDPTHLIENSALSSGSFGSAVSSFYHTKRSFFFARFDLHKYSDDLFTKLFAKKSGEKLEELSFQEAKRNWENFLDEVKKSNWLGYTRIEEIDLEASAMSFIHQKFSDKYLINNVDSYYEVTPSSWDEQSLGMFFHNQFNINHYTSPHFTLTSENYYYVPIMHMIWDPAFLRQGENLSLINSKEFVLKIWNDVTKEISKGRVSGISSSAFLELIIDYRTLPDSSMEGHLSFLKAIEEAGREDDRLAQLVGIIKESASSSNPEAHRRNLLQQLREMSESEADVTTICNRLYEQFCLQQNYNPCCLSNLLSR